MSNIFRDKPNKPEIDLPKDNIWLFNQRIPNHWKHTSIQIRCSFILRQLVETHNFFPNTFFRKTLPNSEISWYKL